MGSFFTMLVWRLIILFQVGKYAFDVAGLVDKYYGKLSAYNVSAVQACQISGEATLNQLADIALIFMYIVGLLVVEASVYHYKKVKQG